MPDGKEYISKQDDNGSINISEEVIGIISAEAISQVEGVGGISNTIGKDIAELLGKKSAFKGVKVSVENSQITIDAFILVKYGSPVNTVAASVQNAIFDAVEDMTGLTVAAVNIHVSGIAFDKN